MLPPAPAVATGHLYPRLDRLLRQVATTPGANRYRKRFDLRTHLWILLTHVLLGSRSLRCTYAQLVAQPRWWQRLGLGRPISFSQVARSSTSRPSAPVERLFARVVRQAQQQASRQPDWQRLRCVQAIDSTFLRLSARLSPWSQQGGAVPGVRVQCGLALAGNLPSHLWLTGLDTNDHGALWSRDLDELAGWTLLFDLGYYGHQQFRRLRAAGVHFITRFQGQARFRVIRRHRVPATSTAAGDQILADEVGILGSAHNRRGAVLSRLRRITSCNARGTTHVFLTDRHDLSAQEVVMLYRKRWQIELFFRWLKHYLGVLRPLGYSRAAVWLTVLVAAIVAALLLLLEPGRPPGFSAIAWLQHVGTAFTAAIRRGG